MYDGLVWDTRMDVELLEDKATSTADIQASTDEQTQMTKFCPQNFPCVPSTNPDGQCGECARSQYLGMQ